MKVRINISNIFRNKLKNEKNIKRRKANKRKMFKSNSTNKIIYNESNQRNIRNGYVDGKTSDKVEFEVKKYSNIIKLQNIKKESNMNENMKSVSENNTKEKNKNYQRRGYIINFDESIMTESLNEKKLDYELESEKIQNKKTLQKIKKSYYSLFFCMCILGIFSVIFAIDSYNKYNLEDYVEYADINMSSVSSNMGNQDEVSNNLDTNSLVEATSVSVNIDTVSSNLSNSTDSKNIVNKVVPLSFSKAIEGKIQKIFSMDKVIYSKTLQMWKIHDGVDISASIGSIVKSIEKGIVEKVYNDSFYGMTVVIDHGQGYKSSYSNLDEEVYVKAKQVVKKGTKIGKVGSTSIGEIKDESHLHMSVIKNGEYIDPSSVIK